ncbi:MAG: hypothetical protein WBF53_04240 [Litorimonas sp.]
MTNPFATAPAAWITGFWKWDPQLWGCVGWTFPGARERVMQLAEANGSGGSILCAVYTTKTSPEASERANRGRIMGAYELSLDTDHRDAFSAPESRLYHPERWQHALRATRCWEFPERPTVEWIMPDIWDAPGLARVAGIHGVAMGREAMRRLGDFDAVEVGFHAAKG